MKCSLDISNFLEEISSLSLSVIFLYFFALITEEGFLILPCYSFKRIADFFWKAIILLLSIFEPVKPGFIFFVKVILF